MFFQYSMQHTAALNISAAKHHGLLVELDNRCVDFLKLFTRVYNFRGLAGRDIVSLNFYLV
jgi:hypothetical protein